MQVQRDRHINFISDHRCEVAKTEKTSECGLYADTFAELVKIWFMFCIYMRLNGVLVFFVVKY